MTLVEPKTRAEKIFDYFQWVTQEKVDEDWKVEKALEEKQAAMRKEIEKLTQQAKKRVQLFVDPRSQRIRKNFRKLNDNLSEIRKVDPSLSALQEIPLDF